MAIQKRTTQFGPLGRHLCVLAHRAGIRIAVEGEQIVWRGPRPAFEASGLFTSPRMDWSFKSRRWIYTSEGIRGYMHRDKDGLRLQLQSFYFCNRVGAQQLAELAKQDAGFLAFRAKLLRAPTGLAAEQPEGA